VSERRVLAVACAALALVARPAASGDRLLARVENAVAAAPVAAAERGAALAPLAAELERQVREQRAEFDAAAAQLLPPKARARLEATRQAWEATQARLPELLRAGRTEEALALVRRLREASRPEPLSAGELKTRIPDLRPPALSVGATTAAVPGAEAPIGAVPPEVRQQAETLSGPIEIYEWVRNGIRPELYHGFVKGPLQTYYEGSGNDADTASLLVALLRAKGLPARYVRGTVDLSAEAAAALTGTSSPQRALRAFARAGIPAQPTPGPGTIAAIRVDRVWAEAYLPYANYRGALLDAHEKVWVPLDAGFKRLAPPGGIGLRGLGFVPDDVFEAYLKAAPGPATALDAYRSRAKEVLAAQRPDLAYEEALARRDVLAQNLGLLPATLPYTVVTRAEVSYEPPEPLVHTARFVLDSNGTELLAATFPTTAILGQRLTLSYVPFEESDEEVVREHGGLFGTPPYLVEVRPVLKLGGVVLASGTGGTGLGVPLEFRIELSTPGGTDTVSNRVLAGNLTAIGLAAGRVTADESGDDEAARILARLAFHYLGRWNQSDEELAALLRVVPIRPSVSTCLVQSAVEVDYAGGDPLYPVRYDWKGLAIDADRRPSAPVGIETDAAERDFLLASGLEGSALEHALFQDDLQIPSVSTAKALQLAAQGGVEVLDLGPGDEAALDGLPLDDSVKDEVRAGLASGYRARVPGSSLSLLAWTGVGYLIFDPATGESAWQLQGGHSGGVTAPAVIDLPKELVDAVWRQSETPSPRPGGVTFIQKFDTTDYQTGTVDAPLARPFRVLVTDEEGFPVPGAAVTFRVIGGGGSLVDPATGRASGGAVTVLSCAGGEKEGPCASLKPGEAVATLRLGRLTSEIPYYTCERASGCTCPQGEEDCDHDQVGYATQVGMNLVTASSGPAVLGEPFTAFGYPERAPSKEVPGAFLVYLGFGAPETNPVNLTVVDRMEMSCSDRHGNPLSNVRLKATYEGPPELGPPPAGGSLFRGATSTPGHVLRARDYARCVEAAPSVIWGECEGEDTEAVTLSSSIGGFFYPITGDSPWSYYTFDFGTEMTPDAASVKYHTDGMWCRSPNPADCGSAAPITLIWQGTRPKTANFLGSFIEAYPVGGTAEVGVWADVVYEEAKVTRTVDAAGEHFRAEGTNVWKRERLLDSVFRLTPDAKSPGTVVAGSATQLGNGLYVAPMTMSPTPQRNVVDVTGEHYPPLVKYLGGEGGDVDPATVDPATLTLTRVKDPRRPRNGASKFDLWGVEATVEGVSPAPVLLGPGGVVSRTSFVSHEVKPPEYLQLLMPRDVRFEVRAAANDALVLAGSGGDASGFEIPAGLALPSGQYYGQLRLKEVSAAYADVTSDRFPLPVCSLLDLETPVVQVRLTRDPVNGRACGSGNKLRFSLCRPARVTLTVKGQPFTGSLDGGAPQVLADLELPAGEHFVLVPAGLPELEAEEQAPFSVEARDVEDPTQVAVAPGVIELSLNNRSVLPVGHTFVKGVDLLDGHLVQQSTDLKVPGRHLGLELTRTYSSAGWSDEGPLGGGWALNYGSGLFEDGECGLVTVVTPDGGSQVFQSDNGLLSFRPQKGYHTRLEREGSVYRFIDKAGNVHHFESPDPNGRPRLDFIEEPHGDRLVFTYDGESLLTKVAEVQPDAGEVRALTFSYKPFDGFPRIVHAEIAPLGISVEYEYDARGNLVKATRDGRNLAGDPAAEPRVEKYGYLAVGSPAAASFDMRQEHQLVEVTDPNGHRRDYAYYGESDRLPGEVDGRLPGGGLLFTEKWELVKEVVEHPDLALSIRTQFSYDAGEVIARSQWKTTVRDGRGDDTLYVLNGNGSPLEIREPLGKTTRMTWAPDDILKTSETDANGRVTEFEHDPRGNLKLERILTADLGPVVTEYRYDSRFNKLTWKKDAQLRETTYTIDTETGDLLKITDAVGNATDYGYDAHGRLQTVTDPRRHVATHSDHDSFGNARTITDPLGNVTTREYDARGRLVHESDTFGREARTVHDGLDRPVEVRRVAGGASDDEVTKTDYYKGGEVLSVTNAKGAKTSYAIDGLSRVVGTETRFDDQVLTTATSYDANGNRETETDRRNITRKHTYDELNRLVRTEIVGGILGEGPTGQVAAFTYDLVGNKRTETDVNGLVTEFRYDGLYHLEKKILPVVNPQTSTNYEELYRYDKVGNLRRVTDANGKATETEYDGLNRPTRVTRDVGDATHLNLVTTTSYNDPEGSHVNKSEEKDVAKGLRTTFLYDELNREKERKVHLEGEDGDPAPNPEPYTTATIYEDTEHAVRVTDPRGVVTRRKRDGLDRVIEEAVDVAGLAGAPPLNLATTIAYDGLGNRKWVRDPEGRTTLFHHDGLGRLVTTIDAKLQETSFTYDGEGLKTSETDRRDVKKLFTYDNLGRPRTTRLESAPFSGVSWSQERQYVDSPQPQRVEIDARGKQTTLDLDGLGRVVKETDARQNFRTFTWDGVNKREETDKRRNKTLFEYDGVNRLTKTTDPLLAGEATAHTAETTYEDALNRVIEKDRRGTVKRTQTDALGRVVKFTDAVGTTDEALVERNTWDGNGNRETQTDAEGHVTRFVYDAASRISSRTDGFGTAVAATTTYVYDKVGNLLEERDARAAELGEPWSVKKTYDELNRLWTSKDGEGNSTTFGYDPEGNRTSIQTPKGPTTTFEYDELGKLLRVIQPPPNPSLDPTPLKTEYAYDENRNRILRTDANLHSVKMEYDELNRLEKTTQDPGGLNFVTETVKFDENGNPEIVKDPKGQTITSAFDELNRLKKKSFAFAEGDGVRPWRYTAWIDYGYDENGNLLTTDEHVVSGTDPPTTLTTTRTYDGIDRLKSETQPPPNGGEAQEVGYTYYRNGLRKTVTDPALSVTQYTYDGQNRLETAVTGFGTADAATTRYTYWPDDLLKTVTYPNLVVATHDYDKADRLLTLTNAKDETPVSSYTYSYDPNGNRLSQVEVNGGRSETTGYTYDDLDRLASVTYPVDAAYPQGRVVDYGYDAVGNRRRETEKDSADALLADKQGVFDYANRLTDLQDLVTPAQSTSFTWDPNGNQLTKTVGGTTTEYRYELRDKLVEVVQGPSTLGRFQYDAAGRRSLKIGEEGLRQYVYDQTSLLAEYDAGGLQKAKYDYGSDRLISLTRPGGEGRRYFSLDGLRSVVNLTDDQGSAVASYHLDAWGNFRFPDELDASRNRFAFTGHIWDEETGLYNAKARYFDPKLGRFLTQDSYLGQIDEPPSLHRYLYARANPATRIDLSGHDDAMANALAAEMHKRTGALASDHRPAEQRGWWENAWKAFYVDATIRAFPGQANMLEGMARQDAKQFASGTGESIAAGAVPVVVKEGGGALLDRFPAVARMLRKDLGELGSDALSKGKEAVEAAAQRLKGLLGEAPTGGNSLVPATGSLPPAPEVVPGLNSGPFEVTVFGKGELALPEGGVIQGRGLTLEAATADAEAAAAASGGRLIPGTPGEVTGGSSTVLGKNMMEEMGLARSQRWSGYQAQHVIPADMAEHPIIQKIGMDLDAAENGMFLRARPEPSSGIVRHRGFHSTYNEVVDRALNRMDVNQPGSVLERQVFELQQNLKYLTQQGTPLYPSQGATVSLWERLLGKLASK
jgi:RHS repeat-associated protein